MAQINGGHIHMTELDLEDVQERILELLTTDPAVRLAVNWEAKQRFNLDPNHGYDTPTQVEQWCVCTLLVHDRILKTIIR